MEESDAVTEVDASSSEMLDALRQEDASLLGLLRVLLSPRTLPHIVLLVLVGMTLHVMAKNGAQTLSSMGFLALAGGYFLTGLLSHLEVVQRLTQLSDEAQPTGSRLKRLVFSFRICLLPLGLAALVWALLLALIGEGGVLGDWTDTLPAVLAFGFIAWAVVQGRGFGRWLSALSASRLPEAKERIRQSSRLATSMVFMSLFCATVVLLAAFEFVAGSFDSVPQVIVGNLPFLLLYALVFAFSWRRSQSPRTTAARSTELHTFSVRWMFFSQALITWHLLTVWRHWVISPGNALLMIEELALMSFTVLMAIWGLTSRSFRSPLKLVSTANALPMGLAFGYAYAGSVAMLTVVLEDVRNVMMAGHIIVALTFLWMQPRVLNSVLNQRDHMASIRSIVDNAVPAVETSQLSADDEATTASIESHPSSENEDDAINFPSFKGVEWKPPEVLATEVEWDDEVEVLD